MLGDADSPDALLQSYMLTGNDPVSMLDPQNALLWGNVNKLKTDKTTDLNWVKYQDDWLNLLLLACNAAKETAIKSNSYLLIVIKIR